MALLVIGLIVVGIVMGNMASGPLQDRLYNLHRSTGALVLVLALIRLCYRLTHPPLPLPAHMPASQRLAAESVHWCLVHPADRSAADRLGGHLGLSGADHRLRPVRAAADPAGEPAALRAAVLRSSRAWFRDGGAGAGTCRGGAASPLRAARPRASTTLAVPTQAVAGCISIFGSVDTVAAAAGRTLREWRDVRRAGLVGAGRQFFFFRFAVARRRCCRKA